MAEGVNLNLSLDKSILDRELKGENATSDMEGDESDNEFESQGRPASIREIKLPDPSFIKDESKHDLSVGNQTINSGTISDSLIFLFESLNSIIFYFKI